MIKNKNKLKSTKISGGGRDSAYLQNYQEALASRQRPLVWEGEEGLEEEDREGEGEVEGQGHRRGEGVGEGEEGRRRRGEQSHWGEAVLLALPLLHQALALLKLSRYIKRIEKERYN